MQVLYFKSKQKGSNSVPQRQPQNIMSTIYKSILDNELVWRNAGSIGSKSYKCGYCGQSIASTEGYFANSRSGQNAAAHIYICHHCTMPTFFGRGGNQTPGAMYGNQISGITEKEVEDLYNEARRSYGVNAYTAVVLCCRKLLMHIAVNKGAEEKKKFIYYVEYLSEKNLIPEGSKGWVDKIRDVGNTANHEIVIMTKEQGEKILKFSEMLLRIIYEFPQDL